MTTFKYLLLVLAALTVNVVNLGAAQYPRIVKTRLALMLKDCESAIKGYTADTACPVVTKYQFRMLTEKGALKWLLKSHMAPTKVGSTEGVSLIEAELESHLGSLTSVAEGSGGLKAIENYTSFKYKFVAALKSAARTRLVYIDPDTYWGPSVNARGLFLVDLTEKTIIEVLHGDLDG